MHSLGTAFYVGRKYMLRCDDGVIRHVLVQAVKSLGVWGVELVGTDPYGTRRTSTQYV